MSGEPAQERPSPVGRGAWRAQIVVPVVVAVLGALLVTALTPLGDLLAELVAPTRATVTGVVMLGEAPLEGATVTLDGETSVTTRSDGAFTLDDVRAGDHQVLVEARAVEPRETDFVVARGDEERALETITVEPTYRLAVDADIVPGSRTVSYDVSVWVDAAAPDLDRGDTVTYTLPSYLSPVPVTGGTRAQSFCYRLQTTVPVDELVDLGTPSTITAQLAVADGPPIGLSSLDAVVAQRPPDCLTVQAADSETGDGDRSSGGDRLSR